MKKLTICILLCCCFCLGATGQEVPKYSNAAIEQMLISIDGDKKIWVQDWDLRSGDRLGKFFSDSVRIFVRNLYPKANLDFSNIDSPFTSCNWKFEDRRFKNASLKKALKIRERNRRKILKFNSKIEKFERKYIKKDSNYMLNLEPKHPYTFPKLTYVYQISKPVYLNSTLAIFFLFPKGYSWFDGEDGIYLIDTTPSKVKWWRIIYLGH